MRSSFISYSKISTLNGLRLKNIVFSNNLGGVEFWRHMQQLKAAKLKYWNLLTQSVLKQHQTIQSFSAWISLKVGWTFTRNIGSFHLLVNFIAVVGYFNYRCHGTLLNVERHKTHNDLSTFFPIHSRWALPPVDIEAWILLYVNNRASRKLSFGFWTRDLRPWMAQTTLKRLAVKYRNRSSN